MSAVRTSPSPAQPRGREVGPRGRAARRAPPPRAAGRGASAAEHFYREQHGAVFAAMLRLYEGDRKDRPPDGRRDAAAARQARGGRRVRRRSTSWPAWVPAAGHAREYGQIVRDNAQMRALLTTSYEIQASVCRQRRRRATWSSAPSARCSRSRTTTARRSSGRSRTSSTRRPTSSTGSRRSRHPLTGTPSGFKDLDEMHRRLSAGQPDRRRGPRRRWASRALVANIAENAGSSSTRQPARWRCSRSRCPSPSWPSASSPRRRGSRARSSAQGPVAEHRWPKILGPAQRLAERRCGSTTRATSACSRSAPRRAACTTSCDGGLGLIIIDYLQLMRTEGRVESRVEQVGRAQPRPEGPGARAGRAGDRALAS